MKEVHVGLFGGHRPDITPVQVTAIAVAGVPIVSKLLAAYGVFSPSPEQLASLKDATGWAVGTAASLVLGDGVVRAARNVKDGRVEQAALLAPIAPTEAPPGLAPDLPLEEDLPSDEEEFADEPETRRLPEDPARGGL